MSLGATLFAPLLDLLYPRVCPCGAALAHQPAGVHICASCLASFESTGYQNDLTANEVALRLPASLPLLGAYAQYVFRKESTLQQHIHAFKYLRQAQVARYLGRQMGLTLQSAPYPAQAVLLPVPLHGRRYRSRGYNQSELLARGLADVLKLPLQPGLAYRTRNNESQTGKTRTERFSNVERLFGTRGQMPRCVWIVDDVMTTGATVAALADALLAAGVQHLFVSTLAMAEQDHMP